MANTELKISEIEALLQGLANLHLDKQEETIFSIGGRGHYENPISDVLAFYLHPEEAHGLGSLVLKALLDTCNFTKKPELCSPVLREATTENGNRIDLLLEGDDWVLIIENKIFHTANNPFDDYKKFTELKYSDKTPYYVILTPKPQFDQAQDWKTVGYAELTDAIQAKLGRALIDNPFSKWVIFLRDFLLNVNTYTGNSMDDEKFNFIESKLAHIFSLEAIKNEFKKAIGEKLNRAVSEVIPEKNFSFKSYAWKGLAITSYCDHSDGYLYFIIYPKIDENNHTRIAVSFESVNNWEIGSMKEAIKKVFPDVKNEQESNDTWDDYYPCVHYNSIDESIQGIVKLAEVVKKELQ